MEYSPPPLFKQGPSALARLIFFVVLALVLLVSDARFKTLEVVRAVLDAGLYPLQRAALLPRDLALGAAQFAVTNNTLRGENRTLAAKNLELSLKANQVATLSAENAHLRALLELRPSLNVRAQAAQVLYEASDPYSRKVVIDRGATSGIVVSSPVINETGVLGQVTRVYPLSSEVTLLTDKDAAIPLLNSRTQVRSAAFGSAAVVGGGMEMRFMAGNADVQVGDLLTTSGVDGVYPPGLPVAKVISVDRKVDSGFARIVLKPTAQPDGVRHVMVIEPTGLQMPARPAAPEDARASAPKRGGRK